jgi:hypothetical protein
MRYAGCGGGGGGRRGAPGSSVFARRRRRPQQGIIAFDNDALLTRASAGRMDGASLDDMNATAARALAGALGPVWARGRARCADLRGALSALCPVPRLRLLEAASSRSRDASRAPPPAVTTPWDEAAAGLVGDAAGPRGRARGRPRTLAARLVARGVGAGDWSARSKQVVGGGGRGGRTDGSDGGGGAGGWDGITEGLPGTYDAYALTRAARS